MFEKILQNVIGGYLKRKAALYEGTPTEGRPWYRSKTVLAGIAVVLRGAYEGASSVMVLSGKPPLPPIPPEFDSLIGMFLGAAAIKGRIDAAQPIVVSNNQENKQ